MRKTTVANEGKTFQKAFVKAGAQTFIACLKDQSKSNFKMCSGKNFHLFLVGRGGEGEFCQIFCQYGQIKSTKRKLKASICGSVRPNVSYISSWYVWGLKEPNKLHTILLL